MLWTHSHIVFENSAHVMHFRICCARILVIFCPLKRFCDAYRHITYYTQSTVCQGGFSNQFLSSSSWAYAGFAKEGQLFFFFGGGGGACDAWRSHAFAREVRGHASPKFFFEWCNLVPFRAYFHNFYTFKKSKNIIIFTKIIINCSHVHARGSRSMVHSPQRTFIKGCNL